MRVSAAAIELIAAQYALGALAPGVRRAVEKRRQRDGVLAEQIRRWEYRLAEFADTGTALSAERSEQVWRQITAELQLSVTPESFGNRTPGAARGNPVVVPWWQSWRWQPWAGALTAAVVAVGVYPWLQSKQTPAVPPALVTAPMTSTLPASSASTSRPPVTAIDGQQSAPVNVAARALDQQSTANVASKAPVIASAGPPTLVVASAPPRPAHRHATGHRANKHGIPEIANVRAPQTSAAHGGDEVAAPTSVPAAAIHEVEVAGASSLGSPVERAAAATDERHNPLLATRGISHGSHAAGGIYTGELTSNKGESVWRLRLDVGASALQVTVVTPQDAGKTAGFHLWAVPNDGGPPQDLGVISGASDVTLTLDSRLSRAVRMAQVLGVSVEQGDGTTPAAPSGAFGFTGQVQ